MPTMLAVEVTPFENDIGCRLNAAPLAVLRSSEFGKS